ncbi:MAG: histidine phosphatase family protein [Clostridia bacterium]|nr:histidine phosphatase family protein [Clostridia bacterium]
MLLYIIRHGDPIYETDSLTEKGKLQAEQVGKRMFDAKIDRIFTSPMGRAKMTAAPACRMLGLEYTVEDWAHEIEDDRLTPFPDGVLKSVSLVQNTYYRENGNIDLDYEHAFDAQGFDQTNMRRARDIIQKGGDGFLERLGYKKEGDVYRILRENNEKVALFCHSAMARAWISSLLHIPIHLMWAGFDYTHTGVTVIEFKNNKNGVTAPRILCYSDMSHVYAAQPDDVVYGNKIKL